MIAKKMPGMLGGGNAVRRLAGARGGVIQRQAGNE